MKNERLLEHSKEVYTKLKYSFSEIISGEESDNISGTNEANPRMSRNAEIRNKNIKIINRTLKDCGQ